ncbi:MAG: histidine ammonia-lyase [Bdellovibrio sp.]
MINIELDGSNLSLELLETVSNPKINSQLRLSPDAKNKLIKSNKYVDSIVQSGKTVYGINTGFGALSDTRIDKNDLSALQYNLIRSHCTGVGDPFSISVTRAMMLIRANCLLQGFSGITPEAVYLLLDFLNKGVTPVVPSKGSVGASGDLAPLAHIALALIGEGEVFYEGKILPTDYVLNQLSLTPVKLGPKDGLALINGTAAMASLYSLAIIDAKKLVRLADIIGAMTLDGVAGTARAFDPRIHILKPHAGQVAVAENMRKLLAGSKILTSHTECQKVQDPYSLRCIPQVHGAIRQTLNHSIEVLTTELNSVTDNPLIFIESDDVISGGNFHGEALALGMDYLAMGMAELCNISERRIEKLINPVFSDLPAFLVTKPGLNSGYMIAHVTAAALTSENKYLCHPASVDSIPTSTDKEDHVSMGVTSGNKLHSVLANAKNVLAIEMLCACQALDFRLPLTSSPVLTDVHKLLRNHVSTMNQDRVISKDIKRIIELFESNEILNVVSQKIGELQ